MSQFRSRKQLSKFLSRVLRHQPGLIGITVDAHGWVPLDELMQAAERSGRPFTREQLDEVLTGGGKQRFALSEDGKRIRATYGHSIGVVLDYEPETPPDVLYHGTATRFLESIRQKGLLPRRRDYVHLSDTETLARSVGKRHGKPVILRVDAVRMHADGQVFYHSGDGTWLTARVDAAYLQGFPDEERT